MNYEDKAVEYAEKYGLIDHVVDGNKMYYTEYFPSETYNVTVDLDTMKEIERKQV